MRVNKQKARKQQDNAPANAAESIASPSNAAPADGGAENDVEAKDVEPMDASGGEGEKEAGELEADAKEDASEPRTGESDAQNGGASPASGSASTPAPSEPAENAVKSLGATEQTQAPKDAVSSSGEQQKPFICYRCGACCRTLPSMPEFEGMHDGEGGCINFDPETNLCRIYPDRPLPCNVLDSYMEQFRGRMKWNDYVDKMMRACFLLRQYHGIEEPDGAPYAGEAAEIKRRREQAEYDKEHPEAAAARKEGDVGDPVENENGGFDPVEEMRKLAIGAYGGKWFEDQVKTEYDRQLKELEEAARKEEEKAHGVDSKAGAADAADASGMEALQGDGEGKPAGIDAAEDSVLAAPEESARERMARFEQDMRQKTISPKMTNAVESNAGKKPEDRVSEEA